MAGWLLTRWPGGYFSVARRPKLDYSVGTAFGWRMRTGHGVGDPRQANQDGQVGPGSTSERPEEFWRILVENSLDMVMIAGPDNVVRYASPSVEPVLGYRPGEYVGVDFAGLIHPDDAERMLSEIDGASREPGLHGIKTARYRHKDGSWRWIEGVASSNMLDHPAFGGMIYYGRDVTERVLAQERERFLSLVIEQAVAMILVADADGTARYVSKSVEQVLGYEPDEMMGSKPPDLVHPDDVEGLMQWWTRTAANPGAVGHTENRWRHKDGSWRWIAGTLHNLLDDPNVRGMVGAGWGVTERKELEEALRQSEARFRFLASSTPDVVLISESDGALRYISPSIERVLGYTPWQFLKRGIIDNVHPGDVEDLAGSIAQATANPGVRLIGQHRYRHKDGSYRWLEAIVNNEIEPGVGVVSCRDVTERKELEEKLRFLSLLVENAHDIVGVVEADGTTRYVSPSVERVLGYRPEEMIGAKASDYSHPDDLEWQAFRLAEVPNNPAFDPRQESRMRHKDGSWRWIEGVASDMLNDPDVGGIAFVARDITERKGLEERLRESEKRFRMLVENMWDFILISDVDGFIRYVSPSIEWVLGYTPEEFSTFKPSNVVHPDDIEYVMSQIGKAAEESGVRVSGEGRYRHKDGSWRWIETVANSLLGDPDVVTLIISGRDTTERKLAEEEIRRLNETLETRVEERTAQLEGMVAKLEAQEQMLRESEEQFRTAFEQAAVGMAHISLDGRYLRVNETFCEITV